MGAFRSVGPSCEMTLFLTRWAAFQSFDRVRTAAWHGELDADCLLGGAIGRYPSALAWNLPTTNWFWNGPIWLFLYSAKLRQRRLQMPGHVLQDRSYCPQPCRTSSSSLLPMAKGVENHVPRRSTLFIRCKALTKSAVSYSLKNL